ncbi:putative protein kinase RLK-Pelle-CrRLK1L-1 family [Helianthus annuus]|nr:putative protein kinase RLK-Pelle-CrRLK1L-1 family [Helianthus annuus]
MDPCSFISGKLTTMSDVYSFGVVLLEVLCRKPAVFVLKWLQLQDSVKDKRVEKSPEFSNRNSDDVSDSNLRNLLDIIDADLRNEISPKSLKAYFGIAQRCLHNIPNVRISKYFSSSHSFGSLFVGLILISLVSWTIVDVAIGLLVVMGL